MTQSQHTQGPWIIQGDDIVVDGFTIGGINIDDAEKRPEEAKANLALMASAPELLEALEGLYSCCANGDELAPLRSDGAVRWAKAWEKAYSAIKKSKGETNA